jgi:hypothetical protein
VYAGIEPELASGPVVLDLAPPVVGEAAHHLMLLCSDAGADNRNIIRPIAARAADRRRRPIVALPPPQPAREDETHNILGPRMDANPPTAPPATYAHTPSDKS